MSIGNIRLIVGNIAAWDAAEDDEANVQIREDDDAFVSRRNVRLAWATKAGADVNVTWHVSVTPHVRYKYNEAQDPPDERITLSAYEGTWAASACNPARVRGEWHWSHALDLGTFLDDVAGGSKWLYEDRVADDIMLEVTLQSTYDEGWAEKYDADGDGMSEAASRVLYVGYVPMYLVSSATLTAEGTVKVTYTTSWTRPDDRFFVHHVWRDGKDLTRREKAWGVVSGLGELEFPASYLWSSDLVGRSVTFFIRFNPSYRLRADASDEDDFSHTSNAVTVGNALANTPELAVAVGFPDAYGRLRVTVSDYVDEGNPALVRAIVQIDGGSYRSDCQTCDVPGYVTFPYPPLGQDLTVTAVGISANGDTGPVATLAVPAIDAGGAAWVQAASDYTSLLKLEYHVRGDQLGPQLSAKPEVEVVKLSGRTLPSAFYGTGGEEEFSYSGVALDEGADWTADVLALGMRGDLLCRFPDGSRYKVSGSVQTARRNMRLKTMTVSGSVVE